MDTYKHAFSPPFCRSRTSTALDFELTENAHAGCGVVATGAHDDIPKRNPKMALKFLADRADVFFGSWRNA
jgi:hypothetical protein